MSLFRSIKFNVFLFLVIALLAAVGTLIPQSTDNVEKVNTFIANHPGFGSLLRRWGFFDIYHTLLFAALLALMAFDVIVCKLANRPPDPGLVPLPQIDRHDLSIQSLRRKPIRLEGVVDADISTLCRELGERFKKER